MMRRLSRLFLGVLAAGSIAPTIAHADDPEVADCYDVVVSARPTRQVPTPIPDCEDCIIMSWPWFVTLDVERVVKGRAPSGRITVLTVQHTYLRTDRPNRFWLRRNTLGGFNALRIGDSNKPAHCAKSAPPADPYISPGDGQTLKDLERESERLYGGGR
jgi:hypothetical protein